MNVSMISNSTLFILSQFSQRSASTLSDLEARRNETLTCFSPPALELITELRHYEVRPALLKGLVALLKPVKDGVQKYKILEGQAVIMTAD